MTQLQIIEKLRTMMRKSSQAQVDWDTVTADSSIASLGFDSLSILDLVYDIQQEFGFEFEAEELVGVKTVGQLADFLEKKQK
ncbi:MAG: phosphopantetheine-binding protein [Kiritimatiellae bacterium]|nr:phosphopantetheine-binding protein [Kiritimatiellia bacterium]MDD5520672.1 phosphopantetheine-binding protein [Kiritimatiellia bacterium]